MDINIIKAKIQSIENQIPTITTWTQGNELYHSIHEFRDTIITSPKSDCDELAACKKYPTRLQGKILQVMTKK